MSRKFISQRIKIIRLSLGKNKREFGEIFDPPASDSIVSRWEADKSIPNAERLKKIADLGNISVDELLADPVTKCPRCKYEGIRNDYKFCPVCGLKVEV